LAKAEKIMPSFTVRHLTPADAADYRAVRLAALQNAPEAFGSTYESEAARPMSGWEERLAAPGAFGAFIGHEIVGMARFMQDSGSAKERHKGAVYGMYVAPQARGQGVGSALLSALIEHASGIVEQLRLGVVDTNIAAIRLYQKHGFEIFGTERRALKTDAGYSDEVLMALRLAKD
jgi:ribosomal protein S18 acetylase RimI-like enzyme